MVTFFFLSLFFSSGSVKRFTVQGKRIRTSDLLFPKQARYRAALYPGEKEDDVSYRETHAGGKKSSRFFSLKRANSMWFCNPFFPTHFSRVLLLFPPSVPYNLCVCYQSARGCAASTLSWADSRLFLELFPIPFPSVVSHPSL